MTTTIQSTDKKYTAVLDGPSRKSLWIRLFRRKMDPVNRGHSRLTDAALKWCQTANPGDIYFGLGFKIIIDRE